MSSDTERARAGQAAETAVLAVRAVDRAAIVIRGKDRTSWLNGLVTSELAKLGPADGAYGLIVEKKGRIQTDFFLAPDTQGRTLALAVPASLRASLLETLDHYLVMEDAEVEPQELVFWNLHGPETSKLLAMDGAEALAAAFAGKLDLLGTGGAIVAALATEADAFGERLAAAVARHGGVVIDDATWDAVRIERGLPRFGVEVDTTQYPQEASLEKLAVSFDKGCYLGQEVVYMLENRGHVKRKLVPLSVDGETPLHKGDAVTTADGAAVGDVKSSVIGPSGKAFAIAMIKYAQATPGTELRVGERAVRVGAFGA